jgi:NADH-quinone oxidoreductase subunit L
MYLPSLLLLGAAVFPWLWTLILGMMVLWDVAVPEKFWVWGTRIAASGMFFCSLALLMIKIFSGEPVPDFELPSWIQFHHHHFEVVLRGDMPSVLYAALSSFLVMSTVRFSARYLHGEEGFVRFFVLMSFLLSGLVSVSLAGSLDLILWGWEIVGVSSALLIGFYRRNPRASENARRALAAYRLCDLALPLACAWAHLHWGASVLPLGGTSSPDRAVALFIVWALVAKSAQGPLLGWLPRAMEGPTPSSALFYGAVSIHLGPLLLIKTQPIWSQIPEAKIILVLLGASTAIMASLWAYVRTDSKGVLALSSASQVGLILVEIALGFPRLAMLHLCGHALWRTWQFLRAPSWVGAFADNPFFLPGSQLSFRKEVPWPLYVAATRGFYSEAVGSRLITVPLRAFLEWLVGRRRGTV